jgi:adenylate cyclase
MTIPNGVLVSGETAIAEFTEIASAAEQFGEQVTVDLARTARGITLAYREHSERDVGVSLLEELNEAGHRRRLTMPGRLPLIDIHVARERGRRGDVDGAVDLARNALDMSRRSGEVIWRGAITAALVELLLNRASNADLREVRAAIENLAALPSEPGVVLNEIWLLRLRALLARAEGDDAAYRDYRDRYRKMANDLGFEGHMAWAAEMV